MAKKYVDGEYIEITAKEMEEAAAIAAEDTANSDKVQKLVEGLSTATTIAQIRSVAKQILDETSGDNRDK